MYIVSRTHHDGSIRLVWCEADSAVEAAEKVQRVFKGTKRINSVLPAEWVK